MRGRQVDGELHPVPLRLKVAVHGWLALARVACEADGCAQREQREAERDVHRVVHACSCSPSRARTFSTVSWCFIGIRKLRLTAVSHRAALQGAGVKGKDT